MSDYFDPDRSPRDHEQRRLQRLAWRIVGLVALLLVVIVLALAIISVSTNRFG